MSFYVLDSQTLYPRTINLVLRQKERLMTRN